MSIAARAWTVFCCTTLLLGVIGCSPGPQSVPASSSRLAYVGLDDHVYTVAPEGGDPRRVSAVAGEAPQPAVRRLSRWPTWSPDGGRLAFVRFDISRVADDRYGVFVVGADGSGLTRVFDSTEEAPIYLAWLPDGSAISLLTQREQELSLRLIDVAGGQPRDLASGSPLYFAWAPDARTLLLHVNGDARLVDRAALSLLRLDGAIPSTAEPLAARPSDFRAPAWSADGARIVFASSVPGGQSALAVQALSGGEPSRLAVLGAEPAFLWSPAGDRLAFSSRMPSRPLLHQGLETIKADGGERQRVTDGDVAAFFWSPDGKRLAYAAVDPNSRALGWFVSDSDGKNRRQLGAFLPSEDQLFMFAFFDQFAQSHGLWSPDGKYLVYAGSPAESARVGPRDPSSGAQEASDRPSQIFISATDGNSAPRVLVDGSIATWPVPAPSKK